MQIQDALTLISVTPPTPNGDLHVGHLSGPYLGADVYARYCRLRNNPAVSAFSSDTNQSYVVTTAEQLNTDPSTLARDSHESFKKTLAAGQIQEDACSWANSRRRLQLGKLSSI